MAAGRDGRAQRAESQQWAEVLARIAVNLSLVALAAWFISQFGWQ